MTTQDFFAAMDADPADRSVFFALADYLEERGLLEESQAWRLISQSDREPMPPDEYTKGKWWWRIGCSCTAKEIMTHGSKCDVEKGSMHHNHTYIVSWLCPNPSTNQPHPDFGRNSNNTPPLGLGSVHASDSRSEAFQKLAIEIAHAIKEGTLP